MPGYGGTEPTIPTEQKKQQYCLLIQMLKVPYFQTLRPPTKSTAGLGVRGRSVNTERRQTGGTPMVLPGGLWGLKSVCHQSTVSRGRHVKKASFFFVFCPQHK